jgi:hypothetical protein
MWGNRDVMDEVMLPIPSPFPTLLRVVQGPALLDYRAVTRVRMDVDALEHTLKRMLTGGESASAAYCADLAPHCVMTAFGQGRAEGYRCCKNQYSESKIGGQCWTAALPDAEPGQGNR